MPNIRHTLFIASDAATVYRAVTSQEGLAAWWTPETVATAEQGSIARFNFGPVYYKEMKIMSLEPTLVTWLCIAGTEEWLGTTLSFHFLEDDKETFYKTHPETNGQLEQHVQEKGTLLVFQHDNWKDYTAMFAECNYTWGRFLWSLKCYCETGKGLPWPSQHQV